MEIAFFSESRRVDPARKFFAGKGTTRLPAAARAADDRKYFSDFGMVAGFEIGHPAAAGEIPACAGNVLASAGEMPAYEIAGLRCAVPEKCLKKLLCGVNW